MSFGTWALAQQTEQHYGAGSLQFAETLRCRALCFMHVCYGQQVVHWACQLSRGCPGGAKGMRIAQPLGQSAYLLWVGYYMC